MYSIRCISHDWQRGKLSPARERRYLDRVAQAGSRHSLLFATTIRRSRGLGLAIAYLLLYLRRRIHA